MNDIKKAIMAVIIGNAIEYFDIMLYAHLIVMIGPLFFPTSDPVISEFIGLSSIAITYFIRPLGSIIFGYIGDHNGRKKALVLSLGGMIIPTLMIGLLATYKQIGLLAPILLLTCRLLQNFFMSGENTGAALSLVEQAPVGYEGIYSSLLNFSASLGSLSAIFLGYLSIYWFPEVGWRIPFIIGAGIGLWGIFLRRVLRETAPFQKMVKNKKLQKNPLLKIAKCYKINFLCVVGMGAGVKVCFYLTFIYLASIIKHQLQLSNHSLMLHNCLLVSISLLSLPLMGWLSDRYGAPRVIKWSSFSLLLLAYPLFKIITQASKQSIIFLAQIPLLIAHAGLAAPACAVGINLFPISCRYSGGSFTWAVSGMLFIGILPAVGLLFKYWLGDPAVLG